MSLSKIIKYPQHTLEMVALWPKRPLTLIYKIRTLLSISSIILLSMCLIYNATFYMGNFVQLSERLYMLISVMNSVVKATILLYNGDKLVKLLESMGKESFCKYNDLYENVIEDFAKTYKKIEWCYRVQVIMSLTFNTAFAAIVHQPLPMEFPHFNNGTFHYPFYFFETAALFNGGYINTATDLITVSLIWIAAIQLRILNRKLRDTEQNVRSTNGYTEFNVERLTLEYLTECCVHYMDIEEFIINLQDVFSVIIFVQMGASVLAIRNTGINLVTFESIPVTLALTIYVTVMLVQLGLYCWFGNHVFTESEEITTSCYMSPWYKRSKATKKTLFLLMERSKRPMKISGLKFFVLKFHTFVSILKFTYSYFTLLRNNSNA